MVLDGLNLVGLVMWVMVLLMDSSIWKCFDELGYEVRKWKVDFVVLGLLEWLVSGSVGFYLVVCLYILVNFFVLGIKDE